MKKERIGVIGLGDMGLPIARRLLQHGFGVVSCANRRREPIEALKIEGLVEKPDPRSVAEEVDILLTIVVDDKQTDTVLRGPVGAFQTLKPGSVVVLLSTLSPTYCQELAADATSRDLAVLDCPVTGGTIAAENGTLGLLVGGDPIALERCRDAFAPVGEVYYCGNVGMGQIAKLANNAILFATIAAVDEARAMAQTYGMNMGTLMQIFGHGSAQSFVADKWDFVATEWSHIRPLGRKDVGLFIEAAKAKDLTSEVIEKMFVADLEIKSDERAH